MLKGIGPVVMGYMAGKNKAKVDKLSGENATLRKGAKIDAKPMKSVDELVGKDWDA